MRKILFCFLLPLIFLTANANTFYMSPTGNDLNSGAIGSPWLTFNKANNTLHAGDVLLVRGGTYNSLAGNAASYHFLIQNLHGTSTDSISIRNYPGELPTFTCQNINPTYSDPYLLFIDNCTYVHVKGFHIYFLKQNTTGGGISRGVSLNHSPNCTVDLFDIECIGGQGLIIENSANVTIVDTDSHHNSDYFNGYDAADGFSATGVGNASPNIHWIRCRSFMNSDDGFDTFNTINDNHYENCLSYYNGFNPFGAGGTQVDPPNKTPLDTSVFFSNPAYWVGSGEGFKLGKTSSQLLQTITKYLTNCLAFMNRGTGYAANSLFQLSSRMSLINCVAYCNSNDGFSFGAGWQIGFSQIFENNWSWLNNRYISGADYVYDGNNDSGKINNNVWMTTQGNVYGQLHPPLNVSNADFLSVNQVPLTGARQADGSFPISNFLLLAPTSDLIDAGINAGLPFCGAHPDINWTEICSLPSVNIGADKVITLPINSVSFTPTVSGASSLLWSQYSGTAGTIVPNVTTQNITFGNLNTAGVRGIRLCVTNSSGTVCDSATVTVNAAAAVNPSCSAGSSPVTITLPTSSVSLTATGSSNSGNTVSFAWTQYLGTTVTINNANTANATAVGLTAGTYGFQVTVTDNGNALTCQSTKTVNVNAQPITPTANAGSNQTITLPTNSVSLTGSGSGGTINSYLWTIIQGIGGSLSAPTSANANLTGLVAGIYLVQLRVGNTVGNFGLDTVQITVNNAATAPTCSAGVTPVGITLPVNSVGLAATGASTAGNTVSFLWSKLSGTGSSITTPASQITTATGLTVGSYVYRITVTDNVNGLTCTSDKTVTVNAAPNVPPVVTVSPKTQTISLPTTTASVSSTVIISSGTLAGVLWQKLAGSPAGGTITSASSTSTTITALQVGTYRYSLTATDSNVLTGADTLTIIVQSTTTGNGIRYLQASTNGATINLGWSFEYIKYPTARYMVAQERINNVFTDLQPRILPTTKTQDYWYFIDKKKGTYYFRIAQYDTGGAVYYSPMVTVVKKK